MEVGSRRSQERSSCPTEKFTSGGSYPMLNSIVSVSNSVRPPDWTLSVGEPSYSHYLGGFYFAPKSEALVPPRENLGGSYPMLNSIYVRYVRDSARLDIIWGVRKCDEWPSYSHLIGGSLSRWILGAPKSAALVPPRENLGGSYIMLNSIYVCTSVRDQNLDLDHASGGRAFLQQLSRWVLLRSPERSSGPTERESRWFLSDA